MTSNTANGFQQKDVCETQSPWLLIDGENSVWERLAESSLSIWVLPVSAFNMCLSQLITVSRPVLTDYLSVLRNRLGSVLKEIWTSRAEAH